VAESDGAGKGAAPMTFADGAAFSENRDLSNVPGREASLQTGLR